MSSRTQSRTDSQFSLEIERGELDFSGAVDLSLRHRPGSRVTSSRSSVGMTVSLPTAPNRSANGIQILSDDYDDNDEELLLEEYNSDDNYEAESFSQPQSSSRFGINPHDDGPSEENMSQNTRKQISIYGNLPDVDTDEENETVAKIRLEITQQVRQEMVEELQRYQIEPKKDEPEADELDEKVKAALIQMRKYDRILQKRIVKEKQVKRDRIALQKRLREELETLNSERQVVCKPSKEETVNTEKFLSLPPSLARFDKHIDADDDWIGAPVFATQPPESGPDQKAASGNTSSQTSETRRSSSKMDSTRNSESSSKTKSRRSRQHKDDSSQGGKDFIQRNIDLAAEAASSVAMTDDEKKRLAELLENIDEMEEVEEVLVDDSSVQNRLPIAVRPGEGYSLDNETSRVMNDIDRKLESLLGREEFEQLVTAPSQISFDSLQFFSRSLNDQHIEKLGERALQETKEQRDLRHRLNEIEKELTALSTAVESEIESPRLSNDQINELLEQCSLTMSKATSETDSLAQSSWSLVSGRSSLLSNPPHLEESVLRALLEQAKAEGITSRSHAGDDAVADRSTNSQPDQLSHIIGDGYKYSRAPSSHSRLVDDLIEP